MRARRVLAGAMLVVGAWASSSCAPGGFQSEQTINSVRILASSADEPYAKPGDFVNVQVLAVDGRPDKTVPMQVYWLPFVCENPASDAYYACFQTLRGAAAGAGSGTGGSADAGVDSGSGGGLAAQFPPGVALPIPPSSTFQFQMPLDAVKSHVQVAGAPVPYGLAILFNIACAGHLEFLPVDPNNVNPVTVPIGCFDSAHNLLGPDQYVFGFTRVYAYDQLTNTNPLIDHVEVDDGTQVDGGVRVDPTQGVTATAGHCTGPAATCPHVHIGPVVLASNWELDPEALDPSGNPLHEQIWADFYTTSGQFGDAARLLYDAKTGSLGTADDTDDDFYPPAATGDGMIWIVVHDNRGGAAWASVPLHVN